VSAPPDKTDQNPNVVEKLSQHKYIATRAMGPGIVPVFLRGARQAYTASVHLLSRIYASTIAGNLPASYRNAPALAWSSELTTLRFEREGAQRSPLRLQEKRYRRS
jgi:hypothetical protein